MVIMPAKKLPTLDATVCSMFWVVMLVRASTCAADSGDFDGCNNGVPVVGFSVGRFVGYPEGLIDGAKEGDDCDGDAVGCSPGALEGDAVGKEDGEFVGTCQTGETDGDADGLDVGRLAVGDLLGMYV